MYKHVSIKKDHLELYKKIAKKKPYQYWRCCPMNIALKDAGIEVLGVGLTSFIYLDLEKQEKTSSFPKKIVNWLENLDKSIENKELSEFIDNFKDFTFKVRM